jgi:hypothetical protein
VSAINSIAFEERDQPFGVRIMHGEIGDLDVERHPVLPASPASSRCVPGLLGSDADPRGRPLFPWPVGRAGREHRLDGA